jgi:hypothetical protein
MAQRPRSSVEGLALSFEGRSCFRRGGSGGNGGVNREGQTVLRHCPTFPLSGAWQGWLRKQLSPYPNVSQWVTRHQTHQPFPWPGSEAREESCDIGGSK